MLPHLLSALQNGKHMALDSKMPLAAQVQWKQDAARAPRGVPSPEMLHRRLGGTWTMLQTTPSCSLMNQSVINTRRLFRLAGSMLNIHVKEQKHAECKCLHSSKLRGHIYILIVENYKANWRRRIASPLMRHRADYAQASLPCRRERLLQETFQVFFF